MATVHTSSVPFVRAALKELVENLDLVYGDGPLVGVSIGEPPGGYDLQHVIIGEVDQGDSDQEWGHLGFMTRDERYAVDVIVRVEMPGLSCEEAQDRAYEILAEIEQKLREDRNAVVPLGIAEHGVISIEVGSPSDVLVNTENGGACAILWKLRVNAQLRITQ